MDSSAPTAVDLEVANALRQLSVREQQAWQDMAAMDLEDARDFRNLSISDRGRRHGRVPPSPDSPVSPTTNFTTWMPSNTSPRSSQRHYLDRLDHRETTPRRPPSNETSPNLRKAQGQFSRQRPSNASSQLSGYSLYPAPTKPLPAIPPNTKSSPRFSSTDSIGRSSLSTTRSSQSSAFVPSPSIEQGSTLPSAIGVARPLQASDVRHVKRPSVRDTPTHLSVIFWKLLASQDKKNNTIHYLDISTTSSTLACKYGNNIIKFWSTAGGNVQSVLKISAYTEARSRSREYLIRSHAILSEPNNLVAIATRFGRSVEIWNWAKKKSLQTIDDADRWTAGREDCFDNGRCPLAVYRGSSGTIDLFAATREKKPLFKNATIDLNKAGLPFVPQYPELALSATSPLLVAAAGPRPLRRGHPPPDRETLLVAWEVSGDGEISDTPYKVARPWQHKDLETALPCEVRTYGSVVVSLWIPANYRAVPAVSGSGGYNLHHFPVHHRFVLVWDLTANSTRAFSIPNVMSCISPDCRYVAYCDANKTEIGAKGSLVILDVITSKEVWSWPDRNALAIDSGPNPDFQQFDDLSKISELSFSADGKFLIVGDLDGRSGIYQVQEQGSDMYQAR